MTLWEAVVLFEGIKKALVLPSGLSNFFQESRLLVGFYLAVWWKS